MKEEQFDQIYQWVDVRFMEKILRQSEKDTSIAVSDVFIRAATAKGDNYTSDMFRVTVEYSRLNDRERIEQKKTVIVKVEPIIEGPHKDLIVMSNIFTTEMNMMSLTLPKMNEILGSRNPLNGRGLFVQREKPVMLVVEDLAPLGFRMADRQAGLDMDHCLLAIRGLARFHASSVALCEKEPEQKQRYNQGLFHKDRPFEMRAFFIEGTKQLAREAANWPELDPKYSEKISRLADKIYERGIEAAICREDEFNVINHGDFWVNNMLFKYDDEGRPIEHIFVDFQMCTYTSPALDLNYFFSTSVGDDLLAEHEGTLLAEYRRCLGQTLARSGCRTEPPSIDELKMSVRQRATYGMIASFTLLPIMLQNKDEAKDLAEIIDPKGRMDNPAYRTEAFKKAMRRRLPVFERMGLLD
ncbi:hypothetical protein QAD02_019403 [Eretmocerus hayati]|uniref:Uncharacterized protein n=1 Tax=Eretmocerus hayati TaxID=131215 RepID=A0ACC2PKQ0_9HYME|nr:hypothetical protein QAD02_019403 [Eretmocerus hayati]